MAAALAVPQLQRAGSSWHQAQRTRAVLPESVSPACTHRGRGPIGPRVPLCSWGCGTSILLERGRGEGTFCLFSDKEDFNGELKIKLKSSVYFRPFRAILSGAQGSWPASFGQLCWQFKAYPGQLELWPLSRSAPMDSCRGREYAPLHEVQETAGCHLEFSPFPSYCVYVRWTHLVLLELLLASCSGTR